MERLMEVGEALPSNWMPRRPSRFLFRLFTKDPSRYAAERRGFHLTDEAERKRANEVIEHFFLGYNTFLSSLDPARVRSTAEGLRPFLKPFCYEGASLGAMVCSLLRPRRADLNELIEGMCEIHPDYRHLYYLGSGFGCGLLLSRWPAKVERLASATPAEHRYLCYDGFGFQTGLFHFLKDPRSTRRFEPFQDGKARRACYQGLGRSLRFLYGDEPALLRRAVAGVDSRYRRDCYYGLGVAQAFTSIDRFEFACDYARRLPGRRARVSYRGGLAMALYARRTVEASYFHQQIDRLRGAPAEAAAALIAICDECDQAVDVSRPDSYFLWQQCMLEKISARRWLYQ